MTATIPPETAEGIHRIGGASGNLPDVGAKLPMVVAVDEPVGWVSSWVLWSRAAVSIGVSLVGHVGVLAWLGYASSVYLYQRIPVQQGQASIQLQATLASAASIKPVETEFELVEPEQALPAWERKSIRPIAPAAAAPTPVTIERVDVKLPWPDEEAPEIESFEATAVAQQAIEREDESPAGPRVEPQADPRLARTLADIRPVVECEAEAIEPLTSAASASSPASKASEGANSVPAIVYNPAPQYPADALRARQTGRVVVHVEIAPDGTVIAARVHRTSGSVALDKAAVSAVEAWRFAAAEGLSPGVRQAAIPIRFVID